MALAFIFFPAIFLLSQPLPHCARHLSCRALWTVQILPSDPRRGV